MATDLSRTVARTLWIIPAVLLLLTIYLADAALDLRETLEKGIPATAQVTDFMSADRVDVTYDYVSLRVTLPDGRVIEREKLSLPHAFAPLIEEQPTLQVRVLPGADQEIVIERAGEELIGRPQWRLAAIYAAMSFVACVLAASAVFAWNRYLHRKGDPARQVPLDAAGVSPAQRVQAETG